MQPTGTKCNRLRRAMARAWLGAVWLSLLGLAAGCGTVPITGRSQLNLIPDAQMNQLGAEEYARVLKEGKRCKDAAKVAQLRRVGQRIANAVAEFHRNRGEQASYQWDFALIQDDQTVNAFALPGGKVAFYTGILPFTRGEAGIAVVMGHEIAHVLARHGSERMSQCLLADLGVSVLDQALAQQPAKTRQAYLAAVGMGMQVGLLLPYSRRQELEADHLGMILMAMAGYDPAEAPRFWQRMKAAGSGGALDFLSTHPAEDKRISELQRRLPEALTYYHPTAPAPAPRRADPGPGAKSGR